jgi:soluble lytic murein transglycosylase
VGWSDYRAGRYAEAAQVLETRARLRPAASLAPAFLYWAGRSRRELGQAERARALFEETVRRFKRSYHGLRAREAMASLPAATFSPWADAPAPEVARAEIPGRQLLRIRQLLLVERLDEAGEELRALPAAPLAQATLAWLDWRRGRLRPAINGMKRAYPDWVGEAGDRLPEEAWRILFPLEFGDTLRQKSLEQGLDPALVAALVCQESTFDAGAVSGAGARGLMQVMPPTGRTLARSLGVPYRKNALHEPETSLAFGTHYLKELLDQFGGRVERALAAYNAGPHRVIAWTAGRPDMTAEEFIESIPFTETRFYVTAILGAREQYRRLYALSAGGAGGGTNGATR